jgi:hypothetical protein
VTNSAKQLSNLRRGKGTPEAARRARLAKERYAFEDERIGDAVRGDPAAALAALHADLVMGVRRLTRRWLAQKGDPSRELVSAWIELRRLSVELAHLRGMQEHQLQDAEAFFASLAKRLPNLEAMAATAHPLVEVAR